MIKGSIHFQSALDTILLSPLSLGGYSESAKDLGVLTDSNLTWRVQVSEISRKVHFSFHMLKLLQTFLPFKTKIYLAQTLNQPITDYGDACYLKATLE